MPRFKHKPNDKFGKWTLLSYNKAKNNWLCRCSCGTEKLVYTQSLTSGASTSCGKCGSRKTHGMIHTAEYKSYNHMKYRCLNPNSKKYPIYGGRGITICDSWLESFENFYKDMGPKPTPQHTIDRIDPNKHYEPSNCKWSTPKEQGKHLRTAITYKGEKFSIIGLAEKFGINEATLRYRLRKGLTPEKAIEILLSKKKLKGKLYEHRNRSKAI